MCADDERPDIGKAIRNFTEYDAPLLTKARMALRNNVIKMRTRRDCCGNYGEPGC